MYIKVIYKDAVAGYLIETYDNVLNVLTTGDGISIELPNNQLAVYLHKDIHTINIAQEKPET